MTIMEVMEARHSVRQYESKKIADEIRAELDACCASINAESGMNIQIIYDEPRCFDSFMAHYGNFIGVENYICVVGPKGKNLAEKAGYYGEQLVLKAQELGLNTCWVALTHGKTRSKVKRGEKEVIVIALGYGANQGRPHNNKDISELAAISPDSPQWYKDGVKAAMLAPTAVNQQKFCVKQNGDFAVITAPKGMNTQIDLGIVKCHFEMASGHKCK